MARLASGGTACAPSHWEIALMSCLAIDSLAVKSCFMTLGTTSVASSPRIGTASIAITNAAGATISATGATVSGDGQAVPSALTKVGSIGVVARADTVTLTNNGTISGGADMGPGSGIPAVIAGSNYNSALPDGFAGGVELIADSATLTNAASGVINGSVGLVTAAQGSVSNYGTINGNVTLAASDDSFVQGIGATLTGIGDGGAGTDRLTIDITGGGVLNPQLSHFINFESTHLTGSGSVATSAPLAPPR